MISCVLEKKICADNPWRCFLVLASVWSLFIVLLLYWGLWPELEGSNAAVAVNTRIHLWRWGISLCLTWLLVLSFIGLGVRSGAVSVRMFGQMRKEIVDKEQNRARQEALFEAIFNSISGAVVFADKRRRIARTNPAFTELTGYTLEEVKGKAPEFLFTCSGSDILFDNREDNGHPGYELECQLKDGSVITTETLGTRVHDSGDAMIGYLMILRDITQCKAAEMEQARLESKLRQSCKMEAIGTLAGGIAHDFNNILGIIFVNTDMALDAIPEGNPAGTNIQRIVQASRRARDLVKQILAYSRRSDQKMIPLMPGPLVKESLQFLRSTTPAGVKIIHHVNDGFRTILMDPAQLQGLLVNLFSNAMQAVNEWGTIEVSGKIVELKECDVEERDTFQPGNYFRLSVSDTGVGMDRETQERMFDPFYTTREVGEGTGMGLAAVMGVVCSHRAFITVDSKPGSGTNIQVFFPLVVVEEEQEESGVLLQGTERVLLVDDEHMLVEMAGMFLRRQGFVVTEKTKSREALATFKSCPDAFDVIVTDQTMPEMTGSELATEVFKIRPDIPVLLLSGYSKKISREEAERLGIREFLYKPFDGKTLVRSIRRILDEDAS